MQDKDIQTNPSERLLLDGVSFHRIKTTDVARGWVSVDVEIDD